MATSLTTTDLVHLVLIDVTQPASAAEVRAKIMHEFGRDYDISSIRVSLDSLSKAGLIAVRTETANERIVRTGGGTPVSRPAMLYVAGSGPVPERTAYEIVPGVHLMDVASRKPRGANKKKRPVAKRPAQPITQARPAGTDVSAAVNELVDKLVAERTAGLLQENRELKARLAALRNLIS